MKAHNAYKFTSTKVSFFSHFLASQLFRAKVDKLKQLEKTRLYRLELERQTKIKEENKKKEKEEEAALKKEQMQQYEVRDPIQSVCCN